MESVCFTGACPCMTRDELAAKASEKFEVKTSVTKDLTILVCADPNSGSSKLEKAKKNGTKVISYDEFLKMLDGSSVSEDSQSDEEEKAEEVAEEEDGEETEKSAEQSGEVVCDGALTIVNGIVTNCKKDAVEVVIPKGVTEIGRRAFKDCTALTSVTIANDVTTISRHAFIGCTSLTTLTIGKSVTKIREEAFLDCRAIKTINLDDDIEKMPPKWNFDFYNGYEIVCTEGSKTFKMIKRSPYLKNHLKTLVIAKEEKIKEINLVSAEAFLNTILSESEDENFRILSCTKSVTVALVHIGKNNGIFSLRGSSWVPKLQKAIELFRDESKSGTEILSGLKEIKIAFGEIPSKKANSVKFYADKDGNCIVYGAGCLYECLFYGKNIEVYGFSVIGDWAFKENSNINSVVIGDGVTQIGHGIFRWCERLQSVVLPESVTEIEGSTFSKCGHLTSVNLPSGLKSIGSEMFDGCYSLESLDIPDGIEYIDYQAFQTCESLKSFKFPLSFNQDKIYERTFAGCRSIESIEIPDCITEIGEAAFGNCESLKSIKIPEHVNSIVVYAFSKSALEEIRLPAALKFIAYMTFGNCKSLKYAFIPSGIKLIDKFAFADCTSLEKVEFGGTVEQWKALPKEGGWRNNVPAKTVHCTDGEAEIGFGETEEKQLSVLDSLEEGLQASYRHRGEF